MTENKTDERNFQGVLYKIINQILHENGKIKFSKITQEENRGVTEPEFSDGKLYSGGDKSKIVLFELKNTNWDATEETLVLDAMYKAFNKGSSYFVTGTPRQLVIYETFKPNTTINDRKLKVYNISNVKKDDEVLLSYYEKQVTPIIKEFLIDLSDLVYDIKEPHWDSIDKFFVNKLSSYILEVSAAMCETMYNKINKNHKFREKLKNYLKEQDIFNVTLNFDYQNVYNVCQLANYLLFLKLMFYSYLCQDVHELKLKPLSLPEDKDMLNKTLRSRFNDVLEHGFEMIFGESILDEFEFPSDYIPVFRKNVEELQYLNYKELNADIIGSIYNTLIDNQEQHGRGQHFTNTNEVDIVLAFTVNQNVNFIFDSGCGAGTFLVRAYYFLKHFHPDLNHEQLLEKLWGVEIAPFPVFLATMNLCLLNIRSFENYPVIINKDFSEVKGDSYYPMYFLNTSKPFKVKNINKKEAEVHIPEFDTCIGNPPYIRQELIENKEDWTHLAQIEWNLDKVNKQSDLYVYYLMHTASFLNNKGRIGYVVSGSWLDVTYGTDLQKFLLDHFKIIAIIDNQKVRSFSTASVNTVILILERCQNKEERNANNVRFVRIYKNYEALIGANSDANRINKVIDFTNNIENTNQTIHNNDYHITVVNQLKLQKDSTFNGQYINGHWGAKFLRSPKVISEIFEKPNSKLIRISEIVEVKYGIKTGANDFFYLIDDTDKAKAMSEKEFHLVSGNKKKASKDQYFWETYGWYYSAMNNQHYILEREYLQPILKSQQEATNLSINTKNLKYHVLICNEEKDKLRSQKKKVLKYIKEGEKLEIHKRPSVKGRNKWYDLSNSAIAGDFIFPSKIGEKYRLIDNRKSKVYCDKVNYVIQIKEKYKEYSDTIFLLMNSIFFRHLIDLFARQLTGSQTLSDVDVNVVKQSLIINPALLKDKTEDLNSIYNSLINREQSTIYEEIKMNDKIRLDTLIFTKLGYSEIACNELYKAAAKYVSDRAVKSASIKTTKTKKVLNYEEALKIVKDRFSEISTYKDLIRGMPVKEYYIPKLKAKYPKENEGYEKFSDTNNVYFAQGQYKKELSFDHPKQVALLDFLNKELDLKGKRVKFPTKEKDCIKILDVMKKEYETYSPQINRFLKTNRMKLNLQSIYRDILF